MMLFFRPIGVGVTLCLYLTLVDAQVAIWEYPPPAIGQPNSDVNTFNWKIGSNQTLRWRSIYETSIVKIYHTDPKSGDTDYNIDICTTSNWVFTCTWTVVDLRKDRFADAPLWYLVVSDTPVPYREVASSYFTITTNGSTLFPSSDLTTASTTTMLTTTMSRATFSADSPTVLSRTEGSTQSSNPAVTQNQASNSGLSAGAIVGIALGVLVSVLALTGAVFLATRRPGQKRSRAGVRESAELDASSSEKKATMMMTSPSEVEAKHRSELESPRMVHEIGSF